MIVLALGVGECVPGAFFSAPFRKLLLGRERLVDADLAAIDGVERGSAGALPCVSRLPSPASAGATSSGAGRQLASALSV